MNKTKKKAIAFVIVLFILVAFEVVYIFSELYNENDIIIDNKITDAMLFKEEYESINGTKNDNDVEIRSLNIDEENPFIYSTEDDIVKRIENKETFVVYFGFKTCPWCRSVLPFLIESAKEKNIKTIYYVDVLNIRDKYELNDKHEAIRTTEGSEGYYKLLEKLSNVLDDYSPLTYENKKGKTVKVKIGEKRIYAPNVVIVKNGEPLGLETGIIDELKDPYMEIDNGMSCKIKAKFNCLFDNLEKKVESCDIDASKC